MLARYSPTLVQQMTKRLQEVLDPHDLTPLHWGVLCCLWKEDGLRTTEIAQRLDQLGGTVTVGLDAMERRKLIRRRQHRSDGRVVQIFLTAKGRNLRPVLEPKVVALIEELFACFSPGEYAVLSKQLGILRLHLAESSAREDRQ